MIYWTAFLATSLMSFFNLLRELKPCSRAAFICVYFSILFIVGFRYGSIDYYSYQSLYEQVRFSDFGFPFFSTNVGTTGMEFVWASFSSFFRFFEIPFELWILFVAFISISIKFYFYRKITPYFLLAATVYVSMGFVKDLGQIRNGLAGAILLFSVYPVIKRNLKSFLLVVLLAFGIQAYAIIALPLFWIYSAFMRLKYSLFAIFFGLILWSTFGGVAEAVLQVVHSIDFVPYDVIHKVERYVERSSGGVSVFTVTGIVYSFIALFFLVVKDKARELSSELFFFGVMHVYGVSLFLLFTGIDTISSRSLDLFSTTAFPFLMSIPAIFLTPFVRILFVLLVIGLCSARLYSKGNAFAPYENIFKFLIL